MEITTKTCTKCGEVKDFSEFHKLKSGKHGLRSWCKECNRAYNREHFKVYERSNRDKISASRRERRDSGKEKKRWSEYKSKNIDKVAATAAKRYRNKRQEMRKKLDDYNRDAVANLTDTYIKRNLKLTNLPVTPETIELKREIIKVKRFKKQLKDHVKQKTTSTTE